MSDDAEIARLAGRVHNLEIALQAFWVLLYEAQPEASQRDIDINNMLREAFEASLSLGGFKSVDFVSKPATRND